MVQWAAVETPIGWMSVGVDATRVVAVRFQPVTTPPGSGALLAAAAAQLREYFAGDRTTFDLPLADPAEGWEGAVRAAMRSIPYGRTRTYGEVAVAAGGGAGAARAVGVACNRNPLPVVVPCHRVVGAGGKLVGFGGGLDRKRWLLEHEARITMQHTWS